MFTRCGASEHRAESASFTRAESARPVRADQAGDVIITDDVNRADSAAIGEPNRLASGVGPDSLADPVRGLAHSQPTVVAEFVDDRDSVANLLDSNTSGCCRSVLSALLTSESMHVESVTNSMPDDLTADERCTAAKLIVDNAELFSTHEFDFGRTNKLTHRTDTGQSRPIAQPLRRHPRVYLDLIDQTVDKLLQAGVVEPAASPWSSNVVLVAQPGNPAPRVIVDYRTLNAVTYPDKFPLPKIRDSLDALSGSVYFSTMTFSASFFQLPLDERDRDKTALLRGQYRFTTLPMGACNSPSAFARLMSLVLSGLTYLCCLVYIDDTIVLGRTFDEHLANFDTVLQRFRQANLKLKPAKCKIFQRRVLFLGHIVSAEGVEVDLKKVQCIESWEFPRTVSELCSYLGLCSYYRSF